MPEPIILRDEDDNEVRIPTRNELCPDCGGDGTRDNPAFRNGITASEMAELCDGDDNFREDYLSGRYNVPCETCQGRRVVAVADEEQLTDAQRALWNEHEAGRIEYEAEQRAEARAFGYC